MTDASTDDGRTRYHRTDDEFDTYVAEIPAFDYTVNRNRKSGHFEGERHTDKYLHSGDALVSVSRTTQNDGIECPGKVEISGREVTLSYHFGNRVDTGEVFELEYDENTGTVARIAARVHYNDEYDNCDADGFDVVHVIDLTDDDPVHVTCWLNRKEDNNNRDGNTGA